MSELETTQFASALMAAGVVSGEGKPVSKYAAKKAKQVQAVKADVAAKSGAAPVAVVDTSAQIEGFFSTLEAELMGERQAALDEMVSLREKGFALIAKSKTFNLRESELRANRDAWNWRNAQIKEAERVIFNELGTKGEKSPALRKAFVELQDAYHGQGGDPFKAAKFSELCLNYIKANPRMQAQHEKNLVRAEQAVAAFEAEKAEQERLYVEGVECLELANLIAEENGWPKTEKKGGGK